MAFNKRKKQFHLYRGTNPHPTAEERAAEQGTHVGREEHSWPHATAEQATAFGIEHTQKTHKSVAHSLAKPAGAPAHKTHKNVRPPRGGARLSKKAASRG